MSFLTDMFGGENKYDDATKEALQKSYDEIGGIGTFDSNKISYAPGDLEKFQTTQEITPEQEALYAGYDSRLGGISTDPYLLETRMQAIKALKEQGQTGLNPQDLATLNQMQTDRSRDVGAREAALMQNMAARGGYSPGMEFAARLQAQQSGADRARQEDMDVAGRNFTQKQAAMAAAGQLAGQMQESQFSQAAKIAEAQDIAERFGVDTSTAQAMRNAAAKNAAHSAAFQNAAQVGQANTRAQHDMVAANKAAYATGYDKSVEAAKRRAGVYGQQASQSQAQADRKRKSAGAVLDLGTKILGTAVGAATGAATGGASSAIGPAITAVNSAATARNAANTSHNKDMLSKYGEEDSSYG